MVPGDCRRNGREAARKDAEGSLVRPGPELARVQPPGPARGPRRAHAAARAAEVPGDLHLEPRRVLHEARRRHAHARVRERQRRRRRGIQRAHPTPRDALYPLLLRTRDASPNCASARAPRRAARHLGRSCTPAQQRRSDRVFRAPRFTRADAAQPRSVASVSVHVEPLHVAGVSCSATPRPDDRDPRPGQDPDRAAAVAAGAAPTSSRASAASSRCRS